MTVETRPPRSHADEIEAFRRELAAHAAELAALKARLDAQQQPRSRLSRADRELLRRILPAIEGVKGSDDFTSAEIVHHDDPRLGVVFDGWSAGRLGKLLKRAAGVVIDGRMVERIGTEANAIIWHLVGLEFPDATNSDPRVRPRRDGASSEP